VEYLTEVSRMFRYPLRDEGGRAILLGGAGLGILSGVPAAFEPGPATQALLSVVLSAPAWGYLSGHWFRIIRDSAAGRDHQPLLPNPRLVVTSFLLPAGFMAVVFLLAFAPCLVFVLVGAALPVLRGVTDLLAWLLGLAGFGLFPMILLRYSVQGTLRAALDYRTTFHSVRKVLPPYILCIIMVALLLAAMGLVGIFLMLISTLFLGDVEFLGILFSHVAASILGVYFAMGLLYLLGRLHHYYGEELGWHTPTGTP
jgi:hypothetical protein